MLRIETPNGEKDKVLLHSCCAPCSSAIIECMVANGIRPTVYYYNPNIYPFESLAGVGVAAKVIWATSFTVT